MALALEIMQKGFATSWADWACQTSSFSLIERFIRGRFDFRQHPAHIRAIKAAEARKRARLIFRLPESRPGARTFLLRTKRRKVSSGS